MTQGTQISPIEYKYLGTHTVSITTNESRIIDFLPGGIHEEGKEKKGTLGGTIEAWISDRIDTTIDYLAPKMEACGTFNRSTFIRACILKALANPRSVLEPIGPWLSGELAGIDKGKANKMAACQADKEFLDRVDKAIASLQLLVPVCSRLNRSTFVRGCVIRGIEDIRKLT